MSAPPTDDEFIQEIAIVGMACRLPGCDDLDEFWRNLRSGSEEISSLSEKALLREGVHPDVLTNPTYVRARGVLPAVDLFDARFFGYSAREAELIDPQQRLFLECAAMALEDGGHAPESFDGTIGVYAGAGWNSYMLLNLASHRGIFESDSAHLALLGNDKDNLSTRVSYKLDLRGPSITVQTGCSTSLVAVSLACQSLLTYQCDLVVAGGVSVMLPQGGYLYRPGGILSPDGHCRAFDAAAAGTVVGSGVGVVVLRRLKEALKDGDHIYAVIKGVAVNNDGALKVGYTAPSVDGQARAIIEAQTVAGVSAETIGYVEAHGTGTALGDPIEVTALTKAFRQSTSAVGFCALASVKTNIGHLDAAAGVAGLIKAALALHFREIPPSLHFEKPNPEIDFAASPFFVNTSLRNWEARKGIPRRAGVSSFGLGGTNAHVVLEEAPALTPSRRERSPELLLLSARTPSALEKSTVRLATHLRLHPELDLGDVAHTLQVGRKAFEHRRFVVCRSTDEAVSALEGRDSTLVNTGNPTTRDRGVAFMFSGQGSQRANMARELYREVAAFRLPMDECLEVLRSRHDLDLRPLLETSDTLADEATARLRQTDCAQPALFVIEYALARMWRSLGVIVDAAIGHSVGEYVAATLAEVFSVEDAISLVVTRGRLMQALPPGAMIAVPLPWQDIVPLVSDRLSLAAVNESTSCVVSGMFDAVAALEGELRRRDVDCRRLEVSHGFHSAMMDPILDEFAESVARVQRRPPVSRFISSVTGQWITASEATDVRYWIRHIREPVRFADGLATLLSETDDVLLEVGPTRLLSQFAARHPRRRPDRPVLATLHQSRDGGDVASVLSCLGQVWLSGNAVKWSVGALRSEPRRVRLPTYPFERERYWIEPAPADQSADRENDLWRAFVKVARRAEGTPRNRDEIDVLCLDYIERALRNIGALESTTDPLVDVLRRCRIIPRYHQLTAGLLTAMKERRQSGAVPGARLGENGRTETDRALIDLIHTCGQALPAVLVGEREPLDLFSSVLEPRPTADRAEPLHQYAGLLQRGFQEALERRPYTSSLTSSLQILEIGGGTGIATRAILPVLPPEHVQYTFTDLTKLFVARARSTFAGFPFVRYGVLDIEKPPVAQSYSPHAYDIVVAVNVLHATRSVRDAVAHVRSLLAPGGLLLVWELTRPTLEFLVTYGLLMNPTDDYDRSQGNPLLSRDRWIDTLTACGFSRVMAFPEVAEADEHLIIAEVVASNTRAAELPSLPLPAHPISSLLAKKGDLADWFHVPSWKRSPMPPPADDARRRRFLIFSDIGGLGALLAESLKHRGNEVVVVEPGEAFRVPNPGRVVINPDRAEDYKLLLEMVPTRHFVQTWGVGESGLLAASSFDPAELRHLLFLAQAIGDSRLTELVDLTIVTDHQQAVTGDEVIFPERALTLGSSKVIPLEYHDVRCRSVDIIWAGSNAKRLVDQLVCEIDASMGDAVVAYRGAHRWIPSLERVRLGPATMPAGRLRRNGVYLITGGLGKIGLTIADYLVRTVAAKVILLGRSGRARLPVKLAELQASGAAVMLATADVADPSEMTEVLANARHRFGTIHGVVHAAGVLGDGTIQRKTVDQLYDVLRAKVRGTLVLTEAFRATPLDLLVLFSSLSGVKPGFGQFAYSAANSFLDAYVHSDAARVHRWTGCISWDVWQGAGMAYDATAPLSMRHAKQEDFDRRGILPSEGAEVFFRALQSDHPHVLVSTSDYLSSNERELQRVYLDAPGGLRSSPPVEHARPALGTPFVPAETETEASLVVIWQELLGFSSIGINDEFFDLGGDSLIGTQVLSRVRASFGIRLPTKFVYQYRTIRTLAVAIDDALLALASGSDLDEALLSAERPKR